jgi:hypothetical protein
MKFQITKSLYEAKPSGSIIPKKSQIPMGKISKKPGRRQCWRGTDGGIFEIWDFVIWDFFGIWDFLRLLCAFLTMRALRV